MCLENQVVEFYDQMEVVLAQIGYSHLSNVLEDVSDDEPGDQCNNYT